MPEDQAFSACSSRGHLSHVETPKDAIDGRDAQLDLGAVAGAPFSSEGCAATERIAWRRSSIIELGFNVDNIPSGISQVLGALGKLGKHRRQLWSCSVC